MTLVVALRSPMLASRRLGMVAVVMSLPHTMVVAVWRAGHFPSAVPSDDRSDHFDAASAL